VELAIERSARSRRGLKVSAYSAGVAELLVALGDADLPLPLAPPHEIENQAAIFAKLWKQP